MTAACYYLLQKLIENKCFLFLYAGNVRCIVSSLARRVDIYKKINLYQSNIIFASVTVALDSCFDCNFLCTHCFGQCWFLYWCIVISWQSSKDHFLFLVVICFSFFKSDTGNANTPNIYFLLKMSSFGDKDLDLRLCNPLHLRTLLEDNRFSESRIVLLHASYPYSKEASYLASTYSQVWLLDVFVLKSATFLTFSFWDQAYLDLFSSSVFNDRCTWTLVWLFQSWVSKGWFLRSKNFYT